MWGKRQHIIYGTEPQKIEQYNINKKHTTTNHTFWFYGNCYTKLSLDAAVSKKSRQEIYAGDCQTLVRTADIS